MKQMKTHVLNLKKLKTQVPKGYLTLLKNIINSPAFIKHFRELTKNVKHF
jgi:hypothetical protein